MTTLTTDPCAGVLARLLAEAEDSDAKLDELASALPASELTQLTTGAGDYRQFYGRLKDFHLAVSRSTASLLYILARACRAKTIVEFGTSFGVSTLYLAAALRDNGGGQLIGTEFEATKAAQAEKNLAAAGLGDLVKIREGDAFGDFGKRTAKIDRSRAARRGEGLISESAVDARKSISCRHFGGRRQRRPERGIP